MSYFGETEYAMRHLIELASKEEELLSEAIAQLERAEAKLKVHQWDFQSSDLNEDFSEAYVMAAFSRTGRAGVEVDGFRQQVAILQEAVGTHQIAVQAISGAILQIAKQGISVVHGRLDASPDGRTLGTSTLKALIWQGRNQAIHFEDGNFSNPVVTLFAELEAAYGPKFSLAAHRNRSLAKQVIDLLGWRTYAAYQSDAASLGL